MRSYFYIVCWTIIVVLTSCSTTPSKLDTYKDFFPLASFNQDGMVHKYYTHRTAINKNKETATGIEYRSFELLPTQTMQMGYFDPALKPTRIKRFDMEATGLILKSEELYFNADTYYRKIIQPTYLDLNNSNETYEVALEERNWKRIQTELKDTVILEKSAKIVRGRLIEIIDSVKTEGIYEDIYLKNMGLFSSILKLPEETYQLELVEQLSMEDFRKRSNHNIKHIGYIDSANSLFKNANFKPCGSEESIKDYYNSTPAAGYQKGKQVLRENVLEKVNPDFLFNESGYLTFRFIINCEGQIGRFVTEMADLDYQPKEFNQKTIDHLGKIVASLEGWRPAPLWGKVFDAYAYLTFKLENGKIIEILP